MLPFRDCSRLFKDILKEFSYTFYCTFSAQNLDTKDGGKKSHGRSLMGNFGKHKVSEINESWGCCSGSGSIQRPWQCFTGQRGSLAGYTWCLNSVQKTK